MAGWLPTEALPTKARSRAARAWSRRARARARRIESCMSFRERWFQKMPGPGAFTHAPTPTPTLPLPVGGRADPPFRKDGARTIPFRAHGARILLSMGRAGWGLVHGREWDRNRADVGWLAGLRAGSRLEPAAEEAINYARGFCGDGPPAPAVGAGVSVSTKR